MKIDSTSYVSPNHASRGGAAIELICLHATAGSAASSLAWLCNPQTAQPAKRVSTHYLIDKRGTVYQLVHDERAAWHAGASAWGGRNSAQIAAASIGIELENKNDGKDDYTPAQLTACRDLCAALIARYGIRRANVVRHLDIATPAGRKSDPANFPLGSFIASLYGAKAIPSTPVPTMPPPAYNAARYKVLTCMISEKSTGGPPYAGILHPGEFVEIDATYMSGYAHLTDGRGFVLLSLLEGAGTL